MAAAPRSSPGNYTLQHASKFLHFFFVPYFPCWTREIERERDIGMPMDGRRVWIDGRMDRQVSGGTAVLATHLGNV